MKINALSDLHLIHGAFQPAKVDADLRVIAGDLEPKAWDPEIMLGFLDLDTIFVPGNHDFYGFTLAAAKDALHRFGLRVNLLAAERGLPGRLIVLTDPHEMIVRGVRFVAATQWTDLDRNSVGVAQRLQAPAREGDRSVIMDFTSIEEFSAKTWYDEYCTHAAFLEETLSKAWDGPTYVITHHAPSMACLPEDLRQSPYAAAFAANLDRLIGEVAVWQHGHVHSSLDIMLGETRMIRNPRGYDDLELNPAFDPSFVIEI
jgi:hypothetical protein